MRDEVDVFEELEELGRGGFGVVHSCERKYDGSLFAKKTLLTVDPASIKRFQREVRIIKSLRHRGIIQVVSTHLNSPPYWFVMPLYEKSLANLIADLKTDHGRAIQLFDLILEAVEHAHQHNVIHRDLKPENILIDDRGLPVVTDFGLGRALDALTSRATGTGAWIGTFGYMAPEQMLDAGNADGRSDVFCLGRMLYEMLTGEPRLAIQDHAKLPVGLGGIVQKCTFTDPAKRFQTVTELREAFGLITNRQPRATEQLPKLLEDMGTSGRVAPQDVEELARLIALCHDEVDLLHEIAVRIPEHIFAELDKRSPETAVLLARQFANCVMGRGWDFNYTDVIGKTCSKLYDATSQPTIKALMAAAALEVGTSHNRFYVMDVAARLVADAKTAPEALAIAHAIRELNCTAIEGRVTVWKLHPALRELFTTNEQT